MKRLIVFDCDSTLSSIEGVDELARLKGEEIFRAVEDLTNQAMEGKIQLEQVFTRRMELIRPTRRELEQIGDLYLETLAPGARETLTQLASDGWEMAIVSGGLYPPVKALAHHLGIQEVRAVPVEFDDEGNYLSFDAGYPTAQSGGKPDCLRTLKAAFDADSTVMVGDGVSDLETAPEVDRFIGFGGFAVRKKVKQEADAFITEFRELVPILEKFGVNS